VLYEYRCYYAVPGRLPDLHRRFRDLSLRLFEKHGLKQIGLWTADTGESNRLHYILQWNDHTDRERGWKSFAADREWQAGREASEANGPLIARIVTELWNPTDYSKLV
jgi:hypothetical protein